MRCTASVVLPRVERDKPSASAKRGTLIHAWIEASMTGEPLPDIGRHKITVDLETLHAKIAAFDLVAFEQAYELTPSGAAKCLGRVSRAYPRVAGCFYGTTDIDAESTLGDVGYVIDIKTGRNLVVAPVQNAQLRFLATCKALARPHLVGMRGAIAYLNRDGSWRFVDCEWDCDWLRKQHTAELGWWRKLWTDAQEQHDAQWPVAPEPSVDACKFCDCTCPAKINVWARGADAPPLTDDDAV